MGNTFTIEVWTDGASGEYRYERMWQGESLLRALFELWYYARWQGNACVKLEWRPAQRTKPSP